MRDNRTLRPGKQPQSDDTETHRVYEGACGTERDRLDRRNAACADSLSGPCDEKDQLGYGVFSHELLAPQACYADRSRGRERVEEPGLIYYVADIYVSDLKYLRTASANGTGDGDFSGGLATCAAISQRVNALASICGDHYYGRREGLVVRNGVLYRDTHFEDICVIYSDGRMETLTDDKVDIEAIKAAGPWQVWSFGPGLLDGEGHAKTFADRQSNALGIRPKNPRCAIGYYEPGHYCLVEIEGNRAGCFIGSWGLDLDEMGVLFEKLGCKSAYNFDGGRSAAVCWMGEQICVNYGRTISDIVYVTDDPVESEG